MELRFFGNTQPMSKEWEIENVEVIPVDNPELYRMEPPASTRWGQIATSTLPKNASGQRWKTLKHLKPKSLKNRGVLDVLDHHFPEEIPRGIFCLIFVSNHFLWGLMFHGSLALGPDKTLARSPTKVSDKTQSLKGGWKLGCPGNTQNMILSHSYYPYGMGWKSVVNRPTIDLQ